jgi:hypothetical protein
MSAKHTPGPWFIWKERAMQDEGMSRKEVDFEILGYDHFEVMAGKPIGHVSRSRIIGCHTVVTLDEHDFGGNEDEGRQTALANARLIAAAPDLLEALQEVVKLANQAHNHWDNDRDAKVGKILLALSGHMPRYDKRIDAIHAAIAKATGAE